MRLFAKRKEAQLFPIGYFAEEEPKAETTKKEVEVFPIEKKNAQKGAKAVKVEKTDDGLEMELYITVGYGHPVLEVAESAQKAVKSSIEAMTGCTVSAINIHVGGVTMDA